MPVKSSPIFANYNLMLPNRTTASKRRTLAAAMQMLKAKVTLTTLVLSAWQMGLWLARAIVEQLTERAQAPAVAPFLSRHPVK